VYKVIAFEKFPNGFQFSVMRFSSALSCDQAGRCSHEQQEAAGNVCDRVKVDPRGHEERRRFVMAWPTMRTGLLPSSNWDSKLMYMLAYTPTFGSKPDPLIDGTVDKKAA
jgi:hypothetical protein